MTHYCPVCGAEYTDDVEKCRDDNAKLLDYEPEGPDAEAEFNEIYAAANLLEADRICALLGDEEIEAFHRETSVSQFPSATGARFLVSVPPDSHKKAAELIQGAINDEVVSDLGTFL
jgi:hypothetical protein